MTTHLARFFPSRSLVAIRWKQPPLMKDLGRFEVLRLSPDTAGSGWLFFSNGASQVKSRFGVRYEFFILSPEDDPIHIETLTMFASFSADPNIEILPAKIVEIGRPWMGSSNLDHLLVSLPYPYGPQLEKCGDGESAVRVLWLLPIAASEAKFAREHGVESLERKFEEQRINYMAVSRPSVI